MRFSKIEIRDWRQFAGMEIDFHPTMTVITGATGAGKSTILRILSQHFGWSSTLLATPSFSRDGTIRYFLGLFNPLRKRDEPPQSAVGSIAYSNGAASPLVVPPAGGVTYSL